MKANEPESPGAAPAPAQPPAPSAFDRETQKELIKEALKEWLDAKWATFGKWSAKGIAALALSVLAYLWLTQHGWHH